MTTRHYLTRSATILMLFAALAVGQHLLDPTIAARGQGAGQVPRFQVELTDVPDGPERRDDDRFV